MESDASLAAVLPSKQLVFSVLSFRINLWILPLDQSGVKSTGDLNRITDDEAAVGFSDLTAEVICSSSPQTGPVAVTFGVKTSGLGRSSP